MNKEIEIFRNSKFTSTDEITEEITTIKSTIRKFLELFRDMFSADTCYLYLVNENMDPEEKLEVFKERINEMKENYDKEIEKAKNGVNPFEGETNLIFPSDLDKVTEKNIKILKFIDISQKKDKDEKNYWNYSYRNRPRKYVIFTKDNNGKKIPKDSTIFNEGITPFIYRKNEPLIHNKKVVHRNRASASINSKHLIKSESAVSIGFPLSDEKRTIGVLTIEFYDKNIDQHFKDSGNLEKFKKSPYYEPYEKTRLYIPLLVKLICDSEPQFKKSSYQTLFGGMKLLDCLKKIDYPTKKSIDKEKTAEKIYKDTLHLFYVLERNEYVGYEEILGRVAGYVNDISKYLGLTSESKSFTDFLEKFKKHEELLLYGLNDFRDHFMHQFHVFISGYIIIHLLDFNIFKKQIENSLKMVLDKTETQLNISKCEILRIWFLVSFFHDHAYIFEKIEPELQNFFKSVFDQEFIVKLNWEQLLNNKSKFPTHLTKLQNFFIKHPNTNPDVLMRNYLDSIIMTHDHGVLSALLLLNYFSEQESVSKKYGNIKDDCLYAAFAISIHNRYDNLMENGMKRISFESFPIAFLLSYCDTAQSFGRIGKRQDYRSRFLDIKLSKGKMSYEIDYLVEEGKKIPSPEKIEEWAKRANDTYKSCNLFFEIKNDEVKDKDEKTEGYRHHIYTLSYGYYKEDPKKVKQINNRTGTRYGSNPIIY